MDNVAIFWDYENCPVPSNVSGYIVVNNLRTLAQAYGSVRSLKAYLGLTEQLPMPKAITIRSELQSSGVSLVDCPHNGRKDVADKMIIVDMLAHAIDNPAPSTIILITGDRDFAYAMSILRLRCYRVILVTLPNAHASLTAQASVCFDWIDTMMPASPDLYQRLLSPQRQVQELIEGDNHTSTSPRKAYNGLRADVVSGHKRVDSVSNCIPMTPKKSVHIIPQCSTSEKLPNMQLHSRNEPPSWSVDLLAPMGPSTPKDLPNTQPLPQTANFSVNVHQKESITSCVVSPEHGNCVPVSLEFMEVRSSCSSPEPDDERDNVLNIYRPSTTMNHIDDQQISQGIAEGPVLSVPPHFKILVECLQKFRLQGKFRPLRSLISVEVGKNGTFRKAGVEKFKQYAAMAQTLGIVDLGGSDGNAWIYLKPEWKDAR